jgi:hypothetical protein
MKNLIILTLVSIFLSFEAIAPNINLDKLIEKERNKYLIKVAKEAVMKRGPGYYREVAPPIIKRDIITLSRYTWLYEKYPGRAYYTVEYPFDDTAESFEGDFSAKVFIWEDTGVVFRITFGNGWGMNNLDNPEAWEGRTDIMPFERRPSKKEIEEERERDRQRRIEMNREREMSEDNARCADRLIDSLIQQHRERWERERNRETER